MTDEEEKFMEFLGKLSEAAGKAEATNLETGLNQIASLCGEMMNAFMKCGFTRKEALTLVIHFTSEPTKKG